MATNLTGDESPPPPEALGSGELIAHLDRIAASITATRISVQSSISDDDLTARPEPRTTADEDRSRHARPRSNRRPVFLWAAAASTLTFAATVACFLAWLGMHREPSQLTTQLRPPANSAAFATNHRKQIQEFKVREFVPSDSELTTKLITRAKELLAAGEISAARVFLKELADAGHAPAALALGGTFDPNEFDKLGLKNASRDTPMAFSNIPMTFSDIAIALVWYRKAKDLGSVEAEKRINQLVQPHTSETR
jgi:TPR repeat protein